MMSGDDPVLVTVNSGNGAALHWPGVTAANERLAGVTVRATAPPVPVKGNWCGDPAALSVRVREALRAPAAEGVKVTTIGQDEPAGNGLTQLLVVIL